mgnify:CR=1 FL=1
MTVSSTELRKRNTLYRDLNIIFQLVNCNFFDSAWAYGDGRSDPVVFTAAGGGWGIRYSGGGVTNVAWGFLNSTPVCGDYDGDGRAEAAIWRAAKAAWELLSNKAER